MKVIEKTGKNTDEAIELGLIEMDLEREDVDIEILEEGASGLFGVFGSKEAKVRLSERENAHRKLKTFLEKTLQEMRVEASVSTELENDYVKATIDAPSSALVIGRHGSNLDALEYISSLWINREREDYIHVQIDCENYRKKREQSIVDYATRMADKAKKMRKDVILRPMNAYERRVVHTALQADPMVDTRSEGKDPHRKIIIFLKH